MCVSQPTDDEYREALFRSFDLGDELMTRVNNATLWPQPTHDSELVAADQDSEPFQFTHVIQNLINAAVEHFHATGALVRRAGFLHNGPPFTLGRAAVECAAYAYWLLVPDDAKVRLWRLLAVVGQDTRDFEEVSNVMNARSRPASAATDLKWRRERATSIRKAHALPGAKQVSVLAVITEVDTLLATARDSVNDHAVEIFWRTASGFSHGRQWATLNALVRDHVSLLGNATAAVKISNTESRVLWGTSTAYELINRSLEVYYRRAEVL